MVILLFTLFMINQKESTLTIQSTEPVVGTESIEGQPVNIQTDKKGYPIDAGCPSNTPYLCAPEMCGPSEAWCNNYNYYRSTACHVIGEYAWCCNTEGHYWCDFDVCGSTQAYCDAYNDDATRPYPVHCDIDDRTSCCSNNGIKDYRTNRCCPETHHFIYYDSNLVGYYCDVTPRRNANDGLWADNYKTRPAECMVASEAWTNPAYPGYGDSYCSGTDYYSCTTTGMNYDWYSFYVNNGQVDGECGYQYTYILFINDANDYLNGGTISDLSGNGNAWVS